MSKGHVSVQTFGNHQIATGEKQTIAKHPAAVRSSLDFTSLISLSSFKLATKMKQRQ